MAIVGVDVDLTLVDSDLHWKAYLDAVGHWADASPFERAGVLDYDLSKHYLLPPSFDPYDFWRSNSCYDVMKPKEGAVQVLSELQLMGHDIVFISATKGLHGKSKYNWLLRHFPFMSGVIFTKEKQYVKCDVLIDDRNSFLQKMPDNVKLIKYWTRYTQDVNLTKQHSIVDQWWDVPNVIYNLLEDSK